MSKVPVQNAEASEVKNEEVQTWAGSSYELLKREGELHVRGGDVLQELRKNIDELEELHGRLKFMMSEIQGLVRR